MMLIALKGVRYCIVVIYSLSLILMWPIVSNAENKVECSRPPGGNISCENNQFALCKVKKGEVDGHCKTPPKDIKGKQLSAWILKEVLEIDVDPNDVDKEEYKAILTKGSFSTRDVTIRFRMLGR